MNVAINVFLIPKYGIYGAAFASLFTQFFTNVIIGFIIKPITPNNYIMMEGINPKYLITAVRKILKRQA